jgi:hypothetical protein
MAERSVTLTLPELGAIAGTRAAGGAGLALLLSHHLERPQRRVIGWMLFAVGALSTIPIIFRVRRQRTATRLARSSPGEREMEFARH